MNYLLPRLLSHRTLLHSKAFHKTALFLFVISTLVFSQTAFSDATITYEQVVGMQKSTNIMQIKDSKIRFTPPNQKNDYSLYDSKTRALTHVDSNQKKYLLVDENAITEQAKKAKQQMDMMRQQMMDKMKNMPPEQRKQAEQMMNLHLPQTKTNNLQNQIEQKKTSRTETYAGIQCSVHESYVNARKINEICITEPNKLGLSSQDADTLMSMQEFMKRLQKIAQNMMDTNNPSVDIQGIPLHTAFFGPDGSIKMETRLTGILTNTLSSDIISVPADFSPMQMPEIPGVQ